MRHLILPLALIAAPALAAPVEVTRFHTPESILGVTQGAAAVVAAEGMDPQSLETRSWVTAVQHEVAALCLGAATPGAADRTVEVRVDRQTSRSERTRNPVSVGVGGSTGGWHSGVGLGVGFSFGGGPKERVFTRLSVTIRDRATGRALWEGRAENTENAKDKRAGVDIAAPRLAHALFAGFPGKSGETIVVK
ncbi:MAG: hypothetical protein RIS94_2844 [Pseudomonadota bacterium]|jgi:hypothetical protein